MHGSFMHEDRIDQMNGDFMRLRGADWHSLPAVRRSQYVDTAFAYWRRSGFPYYRLDAQQIAAEFRALRERDPMSAFRGDGVMGSNLALRLANYFQPQMWRVRVSRYMSPFDVFQDDELLSAAIRRSWSIWPRRFGANASNLRRMLKTYPGTASVSNFRPTVAKAVIARFSRPRQKVVDFAAGYGGRLVGCLSLEDRSYLGIEPCPAQVRGLRKTAEALQLLTRGRPQVDIHEGCAEHQLSLLGDRSAHLVFSSPPYHDYEKYSHDGTQSFVRYACYDDWVNGFLRPVIHHSFRILRRGGRLVINVPKRNRRPRADEVQEIAQSAGFISTATIPMHLAKVPYLHPRSPDPFKFELLLVHEKRRGATCP